MMAQQPPDQSLQFHNVAPSIHNLRKEVLAGLQQPQKELPSKYLYDEHGSHLFDQICEQAEYYTTRTEMQIMEAHIQEMAAIVGENCLIIEYGSGNSAKSRFLLDGLEKISAYVPVDISESHLRIAATALAHDYPNLEILPVCADYTEYFYLPTPRHYVSRCVAYYPGSTIGNYHPKQAVNLLHHIASVCGEDGGLLIGVDMKKDPVLLHRAYNDSQGVTAAFNLNILTRLNRELGATFQTEQYSHYAFYNPYRGRVEMHICSLAEQSVQVSGQAIDFKLGETIWTESSYKYTPDDFAHLAGQAGFEVVRVWTDDRNLFSVQYLKVRSNA